VETVEKVWRLGMPEYEKWRTYGEVGIFSGELAAVLTMLVLAGIPPRIMPV
jgi:hypothetical protein